jgi:outer membrane protein assembly factor BamB
MGDRIRRTIVAIGLLASLLVPLQAAGASPAAPDQDVSTGFGVNATHDGRVAGGAERPPLTKAWTRDLGGSVSYPIIVGGRVFVTAAVSASGTSIFALDAATGNDLWGPVALGGTYNFGALTYGGGRIFAVNNDGRLRAFDAATGQLLWTAELTARVTSPPTYRNGRVFVGGGILMAVDAGDGRLLWSRHPSPGSGGYDSSPVATDTAVYIAYPASEAHAYDPATGADIWSNEPEYTAGGGRTVVLADGRLWTRDQYAWYDGIPDLILDPATGAVVGTYRSDGMPAFDGHTGFFLLGGVLEARNTVTGALLWSFAGDGGLATTPVVVDGFLYVTSITGRMWALDTSTGRPVWGDDVGAPIRNASPGAGDGRVVVPASNLLVAYAAAPAGVRAPYIASVHDDANTPALGRDTTPTIVVTGVAGGETVALKDGDVVMATKTAAAGADTVTFNTGPSAADVTLTGDRNHVLTATIGGLGPLGRPSPTFTYTLDTTPPPAPTVTVEGAPSASGTDWSPLIAVSGVASGDTIDLLVDGEVRVTRVMPTPDTVAFFNVDGLEPYFTLGSQGVHSFTASATDRAGNGSGQSPAAAYTAISDPGRFHPLPLARILDTREAGGPVGPGATRTVAVAGRGGVPATGASAVVVNVTVTQPTVGGFLTVFPSGAARPLASSLNFVAGQTVPNLVVAKLGTDGGVSIYNSNGATHVILDVVGWYHEEGGSSGGLYTPLTPTRMLDTRDGTGGTTGPVGSGATIKLNFRGGLGGVPGVATAVVLNVTATQPSTGGYLTAFPTWTDRPLASNLNFVAGQTVPNLVVAKLGSDGTVSIYNNNGTTHVVVDVVGWYGEDESTYGSRYTTLTPARILDTRTGAGPVGPGGTMTVPVAGHGGVPPTGATAVAVNVTVTQPSAGGFLTVFPSGTARPLASNLNFVAGQTVPNLVVAKLGSDGSINVYNLNGTTHVILDVVGWYGG